jgi:hypothetical protein
MPSLDIGLNRNLCDGIHVVRIKELWCFGHTPLVVRNRLTLPTRPATHLRERQYQGGESGKGEVAQHEPVLREGGPA